MPVKNLPTVTVTVKVAEIVPITHEQLLIAVQEAGGHKTVIRETYFDHWIYEIGTKKGLRVVPNLTTDYFDPESDDMLYEVLVQTHQWPTGGRRSRDAVLSDDQTAEKLVIRAHDLASEILGAQRKLHTQGWGGWNPNPLNVLDRT